MIVHLTIFLAESAVMGLMGWIMDPTTQSQLTGGNDATGNMPGLVFLMVSNLQYSGPSLIALSQAFFSQIYSLCVLGLWTLDVYNPPLLRAAIQAFILLPVNGIAGFFLGTYPSYPISVYLLSNHLGYQNNWSVFVGPCTVGSILCHPVWKMVVRIEAVATFLIGVVVYVFFLPT